jgi:hypothetical protein
MKNDFDIHKWQARYLKEETGMPMDKIISALLDTNDGPVGPRSVIYRALEGAYYKQATLDNIADALMEALEILEQEGGRLDSTEFR